MRYLTDCLRMTARTIAAQRLRFILTVTGIVFGTAALIAVLAIGVGGEKRVGLELADIGIKRIWLYPDEKGTAFTGTDCEALAAQLGDMACVTGIIEQNAIIENDGSEAQGIISASGSVLTKMENICVTRGRFFNAQDERYASEVAVIEERLAEKLFNTKNVTGKSLDLFGRDFTLIGTITKRSTRAGDGIVYIPLSTMQRLTNSEYVGSVNVFVYNDGALESISHAARQMLESSSGVSVRSSTLMGEQELANEILDIFRFVISSVAAVSLCVGGIGIMNVMFMSVSARTKEIGIRKSIGASDKQILLQFLSEAVIISLSGAFLGIALGVAMAYGSSIFASIPFIVPASSVALSVSFALCVGIGFGIGPAMRASRVSPVSAFKN